MRRCVLAQCSHAWAICGVLPILPGAPSCYGTRTVRQKRTVVSEATLHAHACLSQTEPDGAVQRRHPELRVLDDNEGDIQLLGTSSTATVAKPGSWKYGVVLHLDFWGTSA